MQTNFFTNLSALGVTGTFRLIIQPQSDGAMIVSLLLADDSLKDKAQQNIPPLVLKGTAADLDEGFFNAVKAPIQQTVTLLTNMSTYEKALNTAQRDSKQETNLKKDKEGKRKKFDEQMKKVEELEKQKKIGEAIGQLPDIKLFPEFSEEIKKKSQQLRSQHGTLSLFEPPAEEVSSPDQPDADSLEEDNEDNENDDENNDDDFNEDDDSNNEEENLD